MGDELKKTIKGTPNLSAPDSPSFDEALTMDASRPNLPQLWNSDEIQKSRDTFIVVKAGTAARYCPKEIIAN